MTLIVTGVLVIFLNVGIGGGAAYFGSETEEPLLEGLKLTIGVTNAKLLGLVAVAGLIASFHAMIYAFGRNIYSLSRAGYFPHWMSITHGGRGSSAGVQIFKYRQSSLVGAALLRGRRAFPTDVELGPPVPKGDQPIR